MGILRFFSIALLVAGIGFTAADEAPVGFTFAVVGSAGLTASYLYDVEVKAKAQSSWKHTYDEMVPDFGYVVAFKVPDK